MDYHGGSKLCLLLKPRFCKNGRRTDGAKSFDRLLLAVYGPPKRLPPVVGQPSTGGAGASSLGIARGFPKAPEISSYNLPTTAPRLGGSQEWTRRLRGSGPDAAGAHPFTGN
jgi:hypothetical protein